MPTADYPDWFRLASGDGPYLAAAVNAPRIDEIWYPGIDRGLAGVETRVARDIYKWMGEIEVL